MVKVIPRTTRRVYITGVALGKTNIFFFDNEGRQIAALDIWGSEIVEPGANGHCLERTQHGMKGCGV